MRDLTRTRERPVRIFSLGRMRNLAVTDEVFALPGDFRVSDYFDAEMGVWLNGGKPFTVELLFSSEVGTYALNRTWHSEQVVEERPDGSVYVRFSTDQRQELVRWILGQGHTVKVLAPPELSEEVRAEAAQVAAPMVEVQPGMTYVAGRSTFTARADLQYWLDGEGSWAASFPLSWKYSF